MYILHTVQLSAWQMDQNWRILHKQLCHSTFLQTCWKLFSADKCTATAKVIVSSLPSRQNTGFGAPFIVLTQSLRIRSETSVTFFQPSPHWALSKLEKKNPTWKWKWNSINCCSSEHPAALSIMRKTLSNMVQTVYGAAVIFSLTLHINTWHN